MDKIIVSGGCELRGTVRISGAKNAALPIIAAALLARGKTILDNIPRITDVEVMIQILTELGVKANWLPSNALEIEAPDNLGYITPYAQAKKLRASNLLLGPLLTRCGRVELSLPGGCNIGTRPMDLHLKGLVTLGASININHGNIHGTASSLEGAKVYLDFPSVGATENIMMAATLAKGQTVIENAAREPEIVDLANFLNAMGAKVRGAGTDIIKIQGVKELKGISYSVIPDRIEAGTFMIGAAITRGDVTMENIIPMHVEPLIAKLREAGVVVEEDDDKLRVIGTEVIKAVDIKTLPYPGFPTDLQSQLMVLMAIAQGTSVIVENVFENRLSVAAELKRMGAQIKIESRTAVIEGIPRLAGAQVKATDLRAGAALILAGLVARGQTEITNSGYIDRGYENIEEKFKQLGASIQRD